MLRRKVQAKKFDLTYITSDSLSEGVGRSQITPLLIKLADKGLSIHLISIEKNFPAEDLRQSISQSGITWSALDFGKNGFLGGFHRVIKLKNAIGETKLIHARSDIPALASVSRHSAPVIWDARALWFDQRIAMTRNLLYKFIYRELRIIERYLFKYSTAISTLTEAAITTLEVRYKSKANLTAVIPTSVDLDKFSFSPIFPERLSVLYSGTYNSFYDLRVSGAFVSALKTICEIEVHWARPRESSTEQLGVGETQIISVESSQLPDLIKQYSFGDSICRQDAGISLTASMPTKIAEFLASGRPVVINKGLGDYEKYLRDYRAGVIIDSADSNMLEKATEMLELLKDPDTPGRCRKLAEEHFSLDKAVENYLQLYRLLVPTLLNGAST